MENNDLKNLENQRDEKIQIYENDDAYLLGEEISGSGDGIFKDNNIKNNQNELLNKLNTNSSPEEEQEEQDQNNENKIDNNLNVNNSLVDKKYHNRGIATQLMYKNIEYILSNYSKKVLFALEVDKNNIAAINLYKKVGMSLNDNYETDDQYCMTIQLNE